MTCTPGWVSQRCTHYLFDDAGRFIGEYDTTTTRWQDTVWFNGQPVAVVQADGVYYVHADHLATPRSIVKVSNGAEVWRWDSEPFGATSPTNPNPTSGGLGYNVRFAGQYLDVESGVYYNGMRDYQPATGRYLQADPIGLRGGLSRYGYAGGNPLSAIDFYGLADYLFPASEGGAALQSFAPNLVNNQPSAWTRVSSDWSRMSPNDKFVTIAVGGSWLAA